VSGIAAGDVEVAAGEGSGDEEGAGSMRSGMMRCFRALQLAHAFHADSGGAGAFDFRSHLI